MNYNATFGGFPCEAIVIVTQGRINVDEDGSVPGLRTWHGVLRFGAAGNPESVGPHVYEGPVMDTDNTMRPGRGMAFVETLPSFIETTTIESDGWCEYVVAHGAELLIRGTGNPFAEVPA